ncbi:MAG: TlyA family RNA methyltransferase, partial [Lachnospiraceae bacterium]|nr:TlyA family RNA methyltransferase [Lachnospiraceae bacterium]
DADIICLIKPQFEAGKEKVGKKGVVRDINVHREVIRDILDFCREHQLSCQGLDYSPIRGPEGNIEFLLWLKNSNMQEFEPDIDSVVGAAHKQIS